MSGELGYPPHRPMPDGVRDRMRGTVREGIAKPRRTARAWYVTAAAVVLVASGAAVMTQALRQPAVTPGPAPAAGGLTLDIDRATSMLDRCWAAVQAAAKTDRVPPREDWIPVFTDTLGADSVVAATAAGKPMFCETTTTTVTVSDPDATPAYVPGTRTGLLLHSATGLVGGVLDPAWPGARLELRITDTNISEGNDLRFSPLTRQFVSFTRTDPAKTRLSVDEAKGGTTVSLPSAPAPLLSAVDRPVPAGDRISPAGRALGDCLSGAVDVVPDPAGYRPGALLEEDGYQVVLGRLGAQGVVCTTEPDPQRPGRKTIRAISDVSAGWPQHPRRLPSHTLGAVTPGSQPDNSLTPFSGMLPATAVTVTCDFVGGQSATADVVDGTFVVREPKSPSAPDPSGVHVRARDANGTVVFEGTM